MKKCKIKSRDFAGKQRDIMKYLKGVLKEVKKRDQPTKI